MKSLVSELSKPKTEQVTDQKKTFPRMHCSTRKKRPICDADFSAIAVPSMHGSGYLDYTVETHASRSLKVMEEFRQQELLCDLVLHVTYKDKTVDFKVRGQTLDPGDASAKP